MIAYKVFENRNGELRSAGKLPDSLINIFEPKTKKFIRPKIFGSEFFVFLNKEYASEFKTYAGKYKDNLEIWKIEIRKATSRVKSLSVWTTGYTPDEVGYFWENRIKLKAAEDSDYTESYLVDGVYTAPSLRLIEKIA